MKFAFESVPQLVLPIGLCAEVFAVFSALANRGAMLKAGVITAAVVSLTYEIVITR